MEGSVREGKRERRGKIEKPDYARLTKREAWAGKKEKKIQARRTKMPDRGICRPREIERVIRKLPSSHFRREGRSAKRT